MATIIPGGLRGPTPAELQQRQEQLQTQQFANLGQAIQQRQSFLEGQRQFDVQAQMRQQALMIYSQH